MYLDINTRREILKLHREGKSQRWIAKHLKISPATVNYWMNRHDTFENKMKSGRPRKTDSTVDNLIFTMSTQNPFMPASEILHILKLPVGKQTIRNRLKEKGLANYVAVKKEMLKPIHKQKRLEFALNYQHWTEDQWKRVWFSDEKLFSSFGKGMTRVWRPKNKSRFDEKYIIKTGQTYRKTVPVWAYISFNSRNIHWIRQKTLNSQYYIQNILQMYLPKVGDETFYFMQDKSPIHTARATDIWLEQHQIQTLPWPTKSPDMNPIENVWAEMERQTCHRHVQTQEELWEMIQETFINLTDEYISNLIKSMPKRLQMVIEAQGNWTKY